MGFVGIGLLFFFIFGVFVIHGGDLEPVIHAAPSEFATIAGAAVSAMLIGQSMDTVKGAFGGMGKALSLIHI